MFVMKRRKLFIRSVVLVLLLQTSATGYSHHPESKWEERPEFVKYFKEAKVEGAFLLYDLGRDRYTVYNTSRTQQGFIPASTYKIFNSLVALETGVVRDENEVLKWDGVDRGNAGWNQDQNMRTAIKRSTVWFYQEVARRVGEKRMQHYITQAGYGNRNIQGGIDQFWLDGQLRITMREQIDFLVKFHRNNLPFSQKTIATVKDILVYEKTESYTMRAKTGWGARFKPQVGWFVGYVERADGSAYFFATNIDILKFDDSKARISITKNILREMKIIE